MGTYWHALRATSDAIAMLLPTCITAPVVATAAGVPSTFASKPSTVDSA